MKILNLIEPGSVVCNVESRSKKHALEILSELLAGGLEDIAPAEVFESLIGRERLGCTALGKGVAVPHGRMPGVEESVAAFVKLSEPVNFDAPDGEPVDLIFGLLVPEDCGNDHLEDLAQVTQIFSDGGFRRLLRSATSSRSLFDLLTHFDNRQTATG